VSYGDGLRSIFPGISAEEKERSVPDMSREEAESHDKEMLLRKEKFAEFLKSKGYTSPYQMSRKDEAEWLAWVNGRYASGDPRE
jgi:hypothetical protein